MADSCARPKGGRSVTEGRSQIPPTYRLWNLGASIIGFLVPLLMLVASYKGYFQPRLLFILFVMLLGPYLLLLSAQVLTETLTWHWKSPVHWFGCVDDVCGILVMLLQVGSLYLGWLVTVLGFQLFMDKA